MMSKQNSTNRLVCKRYDLRLGNREVHACNEMKITSIISKILRFLNVSVGGSRITDSFETNRICKVMLVSENDVLSCFHNCCNFPRANLLQFTKSNQTKNR